MTTFVSVGNGTQPFDRLLQAVSGISAQLPQPVIVQHGSTPFSGKGCQSKTFVEMNEFGRLIEMSELLILHAGAGSVINAVRAGKVPVVVPRMAARGEILDDHQLGFARAMAAAGRVVLVEEPEELLPAVAEALARQKAGRPAVGEPRMIALVREAIRTHADRLGKREEPI